MLVELKNISKSFPGVKALKDVSFQLKEGEVHALLGENGAGKSTLMKILAGVYTKDEGDIFVNDKKVEFNGPRSAQAAGIATIYQELNLCRHLTVAENIYLSRETSKMGFLNRKKTNEMAAKILRDLNIDLDPETIVGTLPVSKQQMVEIAKAFSTNAEIIIMDEPTSALTEKEIDDLFILIRKIRNEGKGVIYISHRLEELVKIVDRVTILRDGDYITTMDYDVAKMEEIIKLMVGREVKDKFPRVVTEVGEVIFKVENISTKTGVKDVSFELREGEIIAFAGLMGAGRTELVRAIFGADKKTSGKIFIKGKEVIINKPVDAIRHGLYCVPEDRKKEGLCIKMSIQENLTLPNLDITSKGEFLNKKNEVTLANKSVENLRIKTPSLNQSAKNLSGGNQQKVVVGKWLAREANVIIFDEPTRGIDVAAKVEIYNLMNDLKSRGIGVIYVSSELPEVMGLADKIIVMANGKITQELETQNTQQEEILKYATKFN